MPGYEHGNTGIEFSPVFGIGIFRLMTKGVRRCKEDIMCDFK
jgi:hypothetical protein